MTPWQRSIMDMKHRNLVATWEMTEGSGTTVYDVSGSQNNLTITPGGGSWTTLVGVARGVYLFDGTTTVMTAASNTNVNFERTQPFSLFSVFEVTASGINQATLISRLDTPGNGYRGYESSITAAVGGGYTVTFFLISTYPTSAIRVLTVTNGSGVGAVPVNAVTDLLITYDGSSKAAGLNVYVNGVLTASTVGVQDTLTTTTLTTINPQLGIRASSGGNIFKGYMGPQYIWKRVLTATEASALHSNFYVIPS